MSFGEAQGRKGPHQLSFGFACHELIDTDRVTPYYDLILMMRGRTSVMVSTNFASISRKGTETKSKLSGRTMNFKTFST